MRLAVVVGTEPVGLPGAPSPGDSDDQARSPRVFPASDRAATAIALNRMGERFHAFCRGDDRDAFRYALAAGADPVAPLDALRAEHFDVILIGRGGAGPAGDLLSARLAEERGAAFVLDVLEIVRAGEYLTVTRDLGRGDRERLTIEKPAVLTISEHAAERHYVSRRRRAAVQPPPFTPRRDAADPLTSLSGPWSAARPRARTTDLEVKTGGSALDRMNALFGGTGAVASAKDHLILGDPAICAVHLKRFLHHHGMLESTAERNSVASEQLAQPGTVDPRPAEPRAGSASRRITREPRPDDDSTSRDRRAPRPESEFTSCSRRGPRPDDPDFV